MWRNVKKEVVTNTEGYLIFDDTVLNKKHSNKIELVRRQYSGNEHQVVRGIGIVNCIYFYPKIEQFWLIYYRIYDPDTDKKTRFISCIINDFMCGKSEKFTI